MSVETKVAAAIGACFLAVSVGVVTQANGAATVGAPDNYELASNPRVRANMIPQEYDGLIPDRGRLGTGPAQNVPVNSGHGVPGL